jgi:uncharacterized protein YjbI with pentapeptide repeats
MIAGMTSMTSRPCIYSNARLGVRCSRPREHGSHCYFHDTPPDRAAETEYLERFKGLVKAGDGAWFGMTLPADLRIDGREFGFGIDARGAKAMRVEFAQCTFREDVDFSGATFADSVVFEGCTFNKSTAFSGATFEKEFRFASTCKSGAVFETCTFRQRVKILGNFEATANFNSSSFYDAADFVGGWIHTAVIGSAAPPREVKPKARYVFGGEVHLESVDFRRPERVQFRMIDLTKAFTTDTDFRKTRFYDIRWYQPRLKRRGLFLEAWARENRTLLRTNAMLEANYRNIRSALEESKDFDGATDFYMGEMEARRRQLHFVKRYLFSIDWLYWALSRYGGSPKRALAVLLGMLTAYGVAVSFPLNLECRYFLENCWLNPDLMARTLSVIDIAKFQGGTPLEGWWRVLEVVARLLVFAQLALFGLALRNRIRRI